MLIYSPLSWENIQCSFRHQVYLTARKHKTCELLTTFRGPLSHVPCNLKLQYMWLCIYSPLIRHEVGLSFFEQVSDLANQAPFFELPSTEFFTLALCSVHCSSWCTTGSEWTALSRLLCIWLFFFPAVLLTYLGGGGLRNPGFGTPPPPCMWGGFEGVSWRKHICEKFYR